MADVVVPNAFRAASGSNAGAGDVPGGGGAGATPATAASGAAKQPPKPSWTKWSKSRLLNTLRLINMCNGVCLVTVAIVSFLIPLATISPSFETITISAYCVFLGLMMCCVELNMGLAQNKLRANFGFLFSFTGRTLFILFCSSMAFAMGGSTSWLCWIVGGLTALNGLFNACVIVTHPAFRSGELSAGADPWAKSAKAEEAVGAYLKSRPDLVLKAVAAVRDVNNAAAGGSAGRGRGASAYPGGADGGVANPYAMVVAGNSGDSGPGRGGAVVDGGGDYYGPQGYGGSASYAEQSATRHGYQYGGPVGTPGAPGMGGYHGGGAIRVQTVTQSVTSTVVEYHGTHPPPPHLHQVMGGGYYGGGGGPGVSPGPQGFTMPGPGGNFGAGPGMAPAYGAPTTPVSPPAAARTPPPAPSDAYAANPFN